MVEILEHIGSQSFDIGSLVMKRETTLLKPSELILRDSRKELADSSSD